MMVAMVARVRVGDHRTDDIVVQQRATTGMRTGTHSIQHLF